MVTNVTSLTGNGLRDWLVQRVTAVVIAAYAVFLLIFSLTHPILEYATWHGLFVQLPVKLFSFLFLLSLLWHAWIGIWTVLTDYVSYTPLRLILQVAMVLFLLTAFVWGLTLVWFK